MVRKKLKFEWDHWKREFSGPSLEMESKGLREAISLIIKDITAFSGIMWKPPIVFLVFVILTCFFGYAASYISITHQKYSLGMAFLISTPIVVFCSIVVRSLRPNRYNRISSFMKTKCIDYQSISRSEGFYFDFLIIDSSIISKDKQKILPLRSKQRRCRMLFRVDAVELFLEFTQSKTPQRGLKAAVKLHQPKSGISVKKVTLDDLLFKKETGNTREGMTEHDKIKLDRIATPLDSDLSARQSLTIDNKQLDKLPSLIQKKSIQLSHISDIHRKSIFKEDEDEIKNIQ